MRKCGRREMLFRVTTLLAVSGSVVAVQAASTQWAHAIANGREASARWRRNETAELRVGPWHASDNKSRLLPAEKINLTAIDTRGEPIWRPRPELIDSVVHYDLSNHGISTPRHIPQQVDGRIAAGEVQPIGTGQGPASLFLVRTINSPEARSVLVWLGADLVDVLRLYDRASHLRKAWSDLRFVDFPALRRAVEDLAGSHPDPFGDVAGILRRLAEYEDRLPAITAGLERADAAAVREVQTLLGFRWPFPAAEAIRRQERHGGGIRRTLDLGDGLTLEMVRIPAGTFVMGDASGSRDERPQRRVEIPKAFWISRREITNQQFARFDPTHDSRHEHGTASFNSERAIGPPLNGSNQPVVRVSWNEASAFCDWASNTTGARKGVRLL